MSGAVVSAEQCTSNAEVYWQWWKCWEMSPSFVLMSQTWTLFSLPLVSLAGPGQLGELITELRKTATNSNQIGSHGLTDCPNFKQTEEASLLFFCSNFCYSICTLTLTISKCWSDQWLSKHNILRFQCFQFKWKIDISKPIALCKSQNLWQWKLDIKLKDSASRNISLNLNSIQTLLWGFCGFRSV